MKILLLALICSLGIQHVHAASSKVTLAFNNTESYYKVGENDWQLESGMIGVAADVLVKAGARRVKAEKIISKSYKNADLYKLVVGKDEVHFYTPKKDSEEVQLKILPATIKNKNERVSFKTTGIGIKEEALALASNVQISSHSRASVKSKVKVKAAKRECKQESESTLKCKVAFKVVIKSRNL